MIPVGDDNPAQRLPVVSWTIMFLCAVAFIWQLTLGEQASGVILRYGFIPARLMPSAEVPWDVAPPLHLDMLISYLFLHGGWLHLLGNLLFLWIFADNVEDVLGHTGFILFYLVCGIVAALGQYFSAPESAVPVIGASGAVSGVLGAYVVLYPRAEVRVAVPIFIVVKIVSLPAWVVLAFWFGVQLLYRSSPESVGANVAFDAHLAGFLAGLLFAALFRHRFRIN